MNSIFLCLGYCINYYFRMYFYVYNYDQNSKVPYNRYEVLRTNMKVCWMPGTAEVRYETPECAAHAVEKLNKLEYPPGVITCELQPVLSTKYAQLNRIVLLATKLNASHCQHASILTTKMT